MSEDVKSPWGQVARAKLAHVFGPQKAESLLKEGLEALGLTDLQSADDLLAFGDLMSKRSGFIGVAGASLRLHALLRGGKERLPGTTARS